MKIWMVVLALTLILWGVVILWMPGFPNINVVIAAGAIASGFLLLLNK